jgi:hypothetical protein
VSNLLGGHERDDVVNGAILDVFRWLIGRAEERYTPSAAAAARPEFPLLGLADAATLELLGTDAVLLTDDAALYEAALRAGRRAELFSYHLAARLS